MGSRFEFCNNTTDRNFELFTPECNYTDDTICTVAIADSIINGKSYLQSLWEWCHKYPHPMGSYGASFATWLRMKSPEPYYSYGNGAAMRVSPVGWLFKDQEDVIKQAAETASITHDHPQGILGAKAVAYAIWYFRNGGTRDNFALNANGIYPGFLKKVYPVGQFDETCQGTVPVAFQIICQADSFEDAIRRAVLQGGDSDTLAAITGSIAEAIWEIPAEIRNFALSYLPEDMLAVVSEFERITRPE